jgi:2-octaprenyl-6-methoxyphenol hydroxylase
MHMHEVDVLIVGGGLVGSSLVSALDGLGYALLQVEAEARAADAAPRWDERRFALARHSVQALDAFGVWSAAAAHAHPIRAVHVSGRGDFGAVRIRAEDYALPALGHTVPARALAAAVEQRAARAGSTARLAPARVQALAAGTDRIAAEVEHDGATQRISARLLVGADGTESFVRRALGIGEARHDYEQTAIVATIETERPHFDCAYERLTETGPFALLPHGERQAGLVYSVATAEAEVLVGASDAEFLARAQARFGHALGRFVRAGRRQSWPLKRVLAERLIAPRAVLIGNAAQTVHPAGAQGFNLGVRDVLALREWLVRCAAERGDPGDARGLAAYAEARRADRDATVAWADTLVRLYARRDPLSRLARSIGLGVLDRARGLKAELAFALMGYRAADAVSAPHAASRSAGA